MLLRVMSNRKIALHPVQVRLKSILHLHTGSQNPARNISAREIRKIKIPGTTQAVIILHLQIT